MYIARFLPRREYFCPNKIRSLNFAKISGNNRASESHYVCKIQDYFFTRVRKFL